MSSFTEQAELAKKLYFEKLAKEEKTGYLSLEQITKQICEHVENRILQNIQNGYVVKHSGFTSTVFNKPVEVYDTFAPLELHFTYQSKYSISYIPPGESDHSDFFVVGLTSMREARALMENVVSRLQEEKILLKGRDAFFQKLNSSKSLGNLELQFLYEFE